MGHEMRNEHRASPLRFSTFITGMVLLTAIVLAPADIRAQQKPKFDQDELLCSVKEYREGNPADCDRFNTPQQKAVEALYQAGQTAMKAGQWDTAIANFTKVVETDPNYKNADSAYYSLGIANQAKRDDAHAIPWFDKAIQKAPSLAEYYEARGSSYSELRNASAAIADLDRAISLDPKRASAYAARARFRLIRNEMEKALPDFDQAIALNPKISRVYFGRAMALSSLGKFDPALADLTKALEIEPGLSSAYSVRGRIYARLGKNDEARTAFNAALKLNPSDQTSRQGLDALK